MTRQRDTLEGLESQPSADVELGTPQPSPRTRPAAARWRDAVPRRDLGVLAALLAVTAFLWGRAGGMSFWLDEGISVGVASHPLRRIPSLLLQDGSPPLYYLLLHGWSSVFGSSNAATHALSLLFALALVPVGLWAGWTLFDRRTGWMLALLLAINPFLAYYATETRMYSMAALLSLVSITAFVHAFVFRRRGFLAVFAVAQALLMYTHNWGLLLGVGLATAVVPCLVLRPDRRRVIIDASLAFGAVALLYLPWVPSLLYQIRHDLQPWGRRADLVWIRNDVATLFGGDAAFAALVLGAGVGIVAIFQARKQSAPAVTAIVLAVVTAVALLAGWRGSVWAYRYLAVVVAPLVLLAALGIARGGQIAVAAVAVAAFLGGPVAVKGPPYQKSNAEAVADAVGARLRPGDLVVLPDFQMVPLMSHYLPAGLRYATSSGMVPDEHIVDWRGSLERLRDNDPADTLPPLIDALPVGARVLWACPPPESVDSVGLSQSDDTRSGDNASTDAGTGGALNSSDSSNSSDSAAVGGDNAVDPETGLEAKTTPMPDEVEFHPLILVRCQQAQDVLATYPGLRVEEVLEAPGGVRYTPVDARVLTKVGAAQRPR